MKKVFRIAIILFPISGLLYLMYITLNTTDAVELNKINTVGLLIYTFVTIILVWITHKSLMPVNEQKHKEVRPYITSGDFDFYPDINEFEFDIFNEGSGLAKDIKIKVSYLNEVVYETNTLDFQ